MARFSKISCFQVSKFPPDLLDHISSYTPNYVDLISRILEFPINSNMFAMF